MQSDKLGGRMENVVWEPPVLSFTIERHGATVMRSTRGELQRWRVDIEQRAAEYENAGHRQLHAMQSKQDVRPIADVIVRLVRERREDARLKWNDDGSVRILIGKILPHGSAVKQTLDGRRRRLRAAIDEQLRLAGWRQVQTNVYAAPP